MERKNSVIALVDYKGQFGSKNNSKVYRGGMDMELLQTCFKTHGYSLGVMHFSEVDLKDEIWKNQIVIYTSQEDPGYWYKDYIEDIVYGLELAGAKIIPSYRFLRANNNKVFMELLRDLESDPKLQLVSSRHYGSLPEYESNSKERTYPLIVKTPRGAKSRGVFKGDSSAEVLSIVKKISKSTWDKVDIKDRLRPYIHKGYIKNTRYRNKFITQNFIPGLQNDWKILVFEDKFFIEYRGIRDDDFRASGSQKFLFDDSIYKKIPLGIFEFAEYVRDVFNMPHWSLDIGFKDGIFYLFEFQALYFSSYALEHSKTYFQKDNGIFVRKEGEFSLEEVYAESLIKWINKNSNK